MVLKDQMTDDVAKKHYINMIKKFSSVPMEQYGMITHIIGSYYGRKYLNRNPQVYVDGVDQETINEQFKRLVNKINSDFIIDMNQVLIKIKDYVEYYRKITFHEWVSDGFYIKDSLSDDVRIVDFYRNMGYDLVMSIHEFKDIFNNSGLYRELSESFVYGAKYLKSYYLELAK